MYSQHQPHQLPKAPQPLNTDQLATIARSCRSTLVDMLTNVNSSHLGCGFSIIDILVTLYHTVVDVDLIKQQSLNRDNIILSKGHAAGSFYTVLNSVGLIPDNLPTAYHSKFLTGHPTRSVEHGVEASTGSLGHGLSMGVGLALAAKHDQRPSRVYVIVGDGECQEGAIWEALNMAVRFKLDNLTIIVDDNNLQGLGRTDEITTTPLEGRMASFGARIQHTDGHDYNALSQAFTWSKSVVGQPSVIIAHTIKGKGVDFIEDKLEWHYKSLNSEQYQQAKQILEPR